MQTIDKRVQALRLIMEREGLDAWIVNGTDPHQSEYVCPRWRSREWISGFSGSAGTVVITKDQALLWVDSRYFIQGAKQIENSCFTLMKLDTPNVLDPVSYLAQTMDEKSKVGIDGATLMVSAKEKMEMAFLERGVELISCPDYLDEIWLDRPAVPNTALLELEAGVAGFTRLQKTTMVRLAMVQKNCTYTLISSLDDIAWVTNLRGNDISYSPVFLSYLLLGTDKAWLFTDPSRFSPDLLASVGEDLTIVPYEKASETIASVIKESDTVYCNPEKTNMLVSTALGKAKIVTGRDFTTDLKACKNETELEGMRRAHLLDGVAMVNFFARLDTENPQYDEIAVSDLLLQQRLRNKGCIGESFGPISGFGEHGAMCHYSATKESSAKIEKNGLLVLDTGGMYEFGMTDITRTILFGEATEEQRHDYTLVLKGNLALASVRFPQGTCGYQLDILARQFLWQNGMTYFHGTGHGVGFRLNVHEGPQVINTKPIDIPLKPGMILSDEPGLYKEGKHGIRIENLVVVQEDVKTEFGQFYGFEVLTLCPLERKLIDKAMLSKMEISMVDQYHQWVFEELKDLVDAEAQAYLRASTLPL
ncbi:Xaa-Pro aminopeptidase [Sphaerochaeta pleomorpha str. Grapes]|uniref:Xaa-Pro aminopeptidase n=1 Tax=Sphaerochaeta pleomorpha (strain ATCC BAA-1885 / DSM 22778 / Grapes) TaxID=158190 RepID=G8QYR9_SPHPG|nr:aminopeptidase P family protein [Sphaerochaeta pleomorpha]AEV29696.1 Xaa-Pro aminopeptidase [Sphaerochaeta pleomorpha str. Grapes]